MLRRAIVVALWLVLGLVSGGQLVASQDTGQGIGTPIPYTDTDGITHGTVTVKQMEDPFTGFEPSSPPADGMRYVELQVVFEAADDQTFDAEPYQIALQDTQGFTWAPGYVPRPADAPIPDFQGQTMSPGNRISGMIGFVVPDAAVIDHILYIPTSSRQIVLTDLVPGGGPAAGTAVTYTDAKGSTASIVTTIADPFTGFDPNYPPADGKRYVLLTTVFENTGALPFVANPYHVAIRDADGNLYQSANVPRSPDALPPLLESQTLSPGDRISGAIGFVVPAAATLAQVQYAPESSRFVQLVDLVDGQTLPPGPTLTPAPVDSATPAPVASAGEPTPDPSAGTAH